jgi:hypothetical protein
MLNARISHNILGIQIHAPELQTPRPPQPPGCQGVGRRRLGWGDFTTGLADFECGMERKMSNSCKPLASFAIGLLFMYNSFGVHVSMNRKPVK